MAISADGAMVPLIEGEWAEGRTRAIGEVPSGCADPEKVHVGNLSSFSRLTDAAHVPDVAEVDTRRRHLVQAKEVCAVMDGADWLQTGVEIHRRDAVRILDFPHAAEHLTNLREALTTGGLTVPPKMLERCVHVLTHRGPSSLGHMADRLSEDETQREDVREHLGSVRTRLSLMHYPTFQRTGWPIGSGMVESANTWVVEARLKGTGMRWERINVNPIRALRNGVCNDRWQETWDTACQQRRDLRSLRRHGRAAHRQKATQEVLTHDLVEAFPPALPPPAPLFPPDPPAMIPGTSRPSEHHPWTRGPACAPQPCAQR